MYVAFKTGRWDRGFYIFVLHRRSGPGYPFLTFGDNKVQLSAAPSSLWGITGGGPYGSAPAGKWGGTYKYIYLYIFIRNK